MKKLIFIVLLSVYLVANNLSTKPIPPSVDNVKNLAMMEIVANKYKDKEALKKKITGYPSPMEISKIFVKAYLDSDEATMQKIAPKEVIDILKKQDAKVRDMFSHIDKYDMGGFTKIDGHLVLIKKTLGEETIYLFVKGAKMPIKFGFIWVDDRWIFIGG